MPIRYSVFSEPGDRRTMQDSVVHLYDTDCDKGLFMVCDGMSGLFKGDAASQTVADVFSKVWELHHHDQDITTMIVEGIAQARQELEMLTTNNTGTTMVMAAVEGGVFTIAHLGDSRGYYLRHGEGLVYRTKDHVTINDEGWSYVSKGFYNYGPIYQPEMTMVTAQTGDRILLCSDGVSNCISEDMLLRMLQTEMEPSSTLSELYAHCDTHALDDYSAILIEVV